MIADLHIHSTYSDGSNSPLQIAVMAKNNNIDVISITDHDCIGNLQEKIDAAKSNNLKYVKGIEISSFYENKQVHILGYGFDENNLNFINNLNSLYKARVKRTHIMLGLLDKHFKIKINYDNILDKKTDSIGSMHIAKEIIKQGYATSVSNAFDKYIGVGKKAFSDYGRVSPYQAIDLIKNADGTPVLAHPQKINISDENREKLIISLASYGLLGIEAVYSSHTTSQVNYYKSLAKSLNLLVTGGSDYHGEGRIERIGDIKIKLNENQLKTLKII